MVLVKSVPYKVSTVYKINAQTRVGNVDFARRAEATSPLSALNLAESWRHPDIRLELARTIYFERKDGYVSREKPIEENLTLEQLQGFVSEGEHLPERTYHVGMSVEEARARRDLIEAVTGRPAVFNVSY